MYESKSSCDRVYVSYIRRWNGKKERQVEKEYEGSLCMYVYFLLFHTNEWVWELFVKQNVKSAIYFTRLHMLGELSKRRQDMLLSTVWGFHISSICIFWGLYYRGMYLDEHTPHTRYTDIITRSIMTKWSDIFHHYKHVHNASNVTTEECARISNVLHELSSFSAGTSLCLFVPPRQR